MQTEIWCTQDIVWYYFCWLPVENVLVLCDVEWLMPFWIFLWLFGSFQTNSTRSLLDFFQATIIIIDKFWVKNYRYCLIILYTKFPRKIRSWVHKNILTQVSVTSNHMSFRRTFCVKLKQQDTSINHLPTFNTDNSVWSSSTLMELMVWLKRNCFSYYSPAGALPG